MESLLIRLIAQKDNAAIANIIRSALKEFKADKPGTVYYDDSTDHLYELFQEGKGIYYVVEQDGLVIGGAGIFHTSGLDDDTCELVKLYLAPTARGKGLAKRLLRQCIYAATAAGYRKIYLETMPELTSAIPLYEKFGFSYLEGPLGKSGHDGCDVWMIKELSAE